MSSGASSGISNGTAGAQGSVEQMNAELTAIANEQKLSKDGLIQSKFHDKQHGKEYPISVASGNIKTKNGINRANFIMDNNGNLHLGNGHSYMAKGQPVKAAGTVKLDSKGTIRRITNLSGHYQPSVKETIKYINQMNDKGLVSNHTWIDIYEFDKTKSGYVSKARVVYSGPFQFMNRRFLK